MGIGGNHPHRLDFSYFVASEISFSQINVGVLNVHPLPFETSPFETRFFSGGFRHVGASRGYLGTLALVIICDNFFFARAPKVQRV